MNVFAILGNGPINKIDYLGYLDADGAPDMLGDMLIGMAKVRDMITSFDSQSDQASQEGIKLLDDFRSGSGSSFRNYGPGSALTKQLANHTGIIWATQKLIAELRARCESKAQGAFEFPFSYGYNSVAGKASGLMDIVGMAVLKDVVGVILGSYNGEVYVHEYSCACRTARVTFSVWNDMSYSSWKRNPFTGKGPDRVIPSGRFRTIHMEFSWDSSINF